MNSKNNKENEEKIKNKKPKIIRMRKLKLVDVNINQEMTPEERRALRIARRRKRRIRFIVIVSIFVVAVLVSGTLIFIDKNGYADIEKINVVGNNHYSTQEIIKTSKAKTGDGLISVNTSKMKDRLVALSYIKDVKIRKKPMHTLQIEISERTAQMAIYYGGKYAYLDKNLLVLEKSNSSGELTVIEGFVPERADVGETFVAKDSNQFNKILKLSEKLKQIKLNYKKVTYTDTAIKIYITDNMVCQGTYDNLMQYVEQINEVIYSLTTQNIERATIYIGNDGYISFSPKIE